jgi:hypothetical protein
MAQPSQNNQDYYPSVVARLQTVNTQIEEYERILFRGDLELEVETALEGNVKHMKVERDANDPIIRTKLDVLYAKRDELEKELQADQSGESTES